MLNRKAATALAVLALVFMVGAATTEMGDPVLLTKQTAGDSLVVAADTSLVQILPMDMTAWWTLAAGDSQAVYQTQVSPDGGTHWYTLDTDTVAAGAIEASGDLGKQYGGMAARVIQDNLTAAVSAYNNAWIVHQK